MTLKSSFYGFIAVIITLATISSCKKEEKTPTTFPTVSTVVPNKKADVAYQTYNITLKDTAIVPDSYLTKEVDTDGDGSNDILLIAASTNDIGRTLAGYNPNKDTVVFLTQISAKLNGTNAILSNTFKFTTDYQTLPTILSSADRINAGSTTFSTTATAGLFAVSRGNTIKDVTLGTGTKLIGYKFLKAQKTHYGWLRISVLEGNRGITIIDGGYNKTPDESILAGEK